MDNAIDQIKFLRESLHFTGYLQKKILSLFLWPIIQRTFSVSFRFSFLFKLMHLIGVYFQSTKTKNKNETRTPIEEKRIVNVMH